eukprot:TRINITY_DN9952_c0_g1_i1.p1 TRINITY_DN9952_c0_g1~~TRINITY_DN9952_c0_g1_i1.p1  ORF type:complete len:331 (-),score=65.19 TRINITY_DN9952_c0_g1_i1:25-933(-)
MSISLQDFHNSGLVYTFNGDGDKYDIFYHSYMNDDVLGEGSNVLLCLHGFPTSSVDFTLVMDGLLSEFDQVITFDFLGFGFSDKPLKQYSIIEQADIAESLMKHIQIQQYHILAHDYGVSVAQELLSRYPQKDTIQTIGFLNGGLIARLHRPLLIQTLLNTPYVGALMKSFITEATFNKRLSSVFGTNTQPSSEFLSDAWTLCNYKAFIPHLLIGYMKDRPIYGKKWMDALIHTNVPTILINGPADPVSGIHLVEAYRKEVEPLSEYTSVVVLDDSIGHYPLVEDPVATNNAYIKFIKKQTI